ncbi:MAG: hypothetical protein AAGU74_05360 [Bacillota bacterium]
MSVPQAFRADIKLLARALSEAKAPAIFGLLNISMENQRLALRLARTLGAYVSLERPAPASLTYGSLSKYGLILDCSEKGLFEAAPPFYGEVLRTGALLSVNAWRYLRALRRNKRAIGLMDGAPAEELEGIYERVADAGGAAICFGEALIPAMIYDQIEKFRGESRGALDIGLLQVDKANRAGAYEIALEEFLGAPASLCEGEAKADEAFHIKKLLAAAAIDAALLIGDSLDWPFPESGPGCPLYAVGCTKEPPQRPALFIPAARLGEGDGGTVLRGDLMPLTIEAKSAPGLPRLTDVLKALLEEAAAC